MAHYFYTHLVECDNYNHFEKRISKGFSQIAGDTYRDGYIVDGDSYCENCVFFCDHFGEYAVGESYEVFYSMHRSYIVCENALNDMGAVYNEEENEWQTAEWFAECTKEDEEEDTEIKNEPKKEIKVGDKCVVVGGFKTFHVFPIGTVVHITNAHNDTFYCAWGTAGQYIKESDLVVVK